MAHAPPTTRARLYRAGLSALNAATDSKLRITRLDGVTQLSENLSNCYDVVLDRNLYDGNAN